MQLPLKVVVLLGLPSAASSVIQVPGAPESVATKPGVSRAALLHASSNTQVNLHAPHVDLSTAFLMFTTSDSFFVDAEEKDAPLFTKSVGRKLGQIVNIPWTRFGVFLTMYNKADRTVLPGVANYCIPDATSEKVECKSVSHTMNSTGIVRHITLLQRAAWRPKQLTFEVVIEPATYKNGDTTTAKDAAHELIAAAQDQDETLATRFHALFPSTLATFSATAFHLGPFGGPAENSLTIGLNPSGHRNGALAEDPKSPETAEDVARQAEAINAETLKKLADLDGALKRSAMAHYDAIRFTPYTPPTVAPSGPLMLPHPDYPPGPD